jgi:Alpha/beta hydrolase
LGAGTVNRIIAQPRVRDNASLIIHGVAGPLRPHWAPGWSQPFQNNLRAAGLRNNDFFEITWSGFDIVGLGIIPETATHLTALLFSMRAMEAAWSKGYDELNFISHSWGTVLSYQAIDISAVPIHDWVTMGSPMGSQIWKPAGLGGVWLNFYSHHDPFMWLNLYPPFSIPNPLNITWNQAAVFTNALNFNRTGMANLNPGDVWGGLTQEHNAYWNDAVVLRQTALWL